MNTISNTYHPILSESDISRFLDRTNGLHDALLTGVQYTHDGISGGNPCFIDPDRSELRLRYLVTSIYDALVELVFTSPHEWQLRDAGFDVTDTSVSFDEKGRVIWTDDSDPDLRDGSYVIANAMHWRFL